MIVTVRLFASLRESLGAGSLERRLEDGATLGDLLRLLEADYPQLTTAGRYALAINEEYASALEHLHDGDEVALIPPVSGGCVSGPAATDRGELRHGGAR